MDEFEEDLRLISTILRTIGWYKSGIDINYRILINNVISFYNVFEHTAASSMLYFKTQPEDICYINSLLSILNLPMTNNNKYIDEALYVNLANAIGYR